MRRKQPEMEKLHKRSDKDWEAIGDANTLARAELIKNSPERLKSAQAWAKKLVEEEKAEAEAMSKVAKS